MSDHMIPVEKVQELIDAYWGYEKECESASRGEDRAKAAIMRSRAGLYRRVIGDLEALLPTKTLADLTDAEKVNSRWMKASTVHGETAVITQLGDDSSNLLFMDGRTEWRSNDTVIPFADEPRAEMPWPTIPF